MKTSTLLLALSLLAGIVLALVGEKPALLALALVPYGIWWLWNGESRLLAALVVSPALSGAFNVSEWITPYKLLLLLAILRISASRLWGAEWQPLPWRALVQYMLLILWAAVRELASGLPPASFLLFDPISVVILMVVMGQLVRSANVFAWLGFVAALSCALQGVTVVAEIARRGSATRAVGLAGHEALLAESIARMFPWVLAILLSAPSKLYRLLAATCLAGGAYAVMGSGSRGGAIGLLGGAMFMLVMTAGSGRKLFQRLALVGIAALVLMQFAPEVFLERVLGSVITSYRTTEVADVTSGRAAQYAILFDMILQEPLVGWGASGYYDAWRYRDLGLAAAAHSAPLEVATQFGIPAALLWTVGMLSGVGAGLRLASVQPTLRFYGVAAAASCLGNFLMMTTAPGAFMSMVWSPIWLAHVLLLRVQQPDFMRQLQPVSASRRAGAGAGAGAGAERLA